MVHARTRQRPEEPLLFMSDLLVHARQRTRGGTQQGQANGSGNADPEDEQDYHEPNRSIQCAFWRENAASARLYAKLSVKSLVKAPPNRDPTEPNSLATVLFRDGAGPLLTYLRGGLMRGV